MLMVDALEQQATLSLQHSLWSVCGMLALQALNTSTVQLGLCAVICRNKMPQLQAWFIRSGSKSQMARFTHSCNCLQMVLSPQPFDLRSWHIALQKLLNLISAFTDGEYKRGELLKTQAVAAFRHLSDLLCGLQFLLCIRW